MPDPPVDPALCAHPKRIAFTYSRDRCEDCGALIVLLTEETERRRRAAEEFEKEALKHG